MEAIFKNITEYVIVLFNKHLNIIYLIIKTRVFHVNNIFIETVRFLDWLEPCVHISVMLINLELIMLPVLSKRHFTVLVSYLHVNRLIPGIDNKTNKTDKMNSLNTNPDPWDVIGQLSGSLAADHIYKHYTVICVIIYIHIMRYGHNILII